MRLRASQQLSRPLARPWRGLSRLERSTRSTGVVRWTDDPRARARVVDGPIGASWRRSPARVGRVARRLSRQAEPLHDAAAAAMQHARRTRGVTQTDRRHALVRLRPLLRLAGSVSSTAVAGASSHIAIGVRENCSLEYAKLRGAASRRRGMTSGAATKRRAACR